MCGLLLKCAFLVVMIHGFRVLGRLAGPRWSALVLGLPSTTAIVLVICGCERGSAAATEMAESSLLGLAAAVALPLAYAQMVRLRWRLPVALTAAVTGYLVVAATLGCLTADGVLPRLGIALFAILSGSYWAGRLPIPEGSRAVASLSTFQVMAARTAIPATYVLVLGIAERMAGPSWAGLMSTFPSMSLVVLAVTHLEAGPAEASRIAKMLPAGNTSTLAFLAAFRLASLGTGLTGGTIFGYMAALAALLMIEGNDQILGLIRLNTDKARQIGRIRVIFLRTAIQAGLRQAVLASVPHSRAAPRSLLRGRPRHRGRFAPRVETHAW
jgi:hypothetical protein